MKQLFWWIIVRSCYQFLQRNYWWVRWAFSILKLLTWKCNHTLVHDNSHRHLHLTGAKGRARFFPSGGEMWVWWGQINYQNLNPLTFKLRWKLLFNFWNTPEYHSPKDRWYGEWTPIRGHAILQFLSAVTFNLDQFSGQSSSSFPRFSRWRLSQN